MRRLLILIPILCSLAFGQGMVVGPKTVIGPNTVVSPGTASGATIAHIAGQDTGCNFGSGSAGCAPISNVTSGHTITANCVVGSATKTPSMSDTFGSTWNTVDITVQSTAGITVGAFYAYISHATGADTITCIESASGTDTTVLAFSEYSGVASSGALGNHTLCNGAANSTCSGGSGNITITAGQALIGYVGDNQAPTCTASGSFTLRVQHSWTCTSDYIGASAGSYGANFGGLGGDFDVIGVYSLNP
jgi:hypothetical protein